MKRCPDEGLDRFEVFVGAAVVANNLLLIAHHLNKRKRRSGRRSEHIGTKTQRQGAETRRRKVVRITSFTVRSPLGECALTSGLPSSTINSLAALRLGGLALICFCFFPRLKYVTVIRGQRTKSGAARPILARVRAARSLTASEKNAAPCLDVPGGAQGRHKSEVGVVLLCT